MLVHVAAIKPASNVRLARLSLGNIQVSLAHINVLIPCLRSLNDFDATGVIKFAIVFKCISQAFPTQIYLFQASKSNPTQRLTS